ncbi:MAG TPA: hypothetical protein VIV40_27500 [Kofleriaceae bacterium]
MTMRLGRLRELSPRAILAIGFGLFLLYAFPGYMSTDSINQLAEARTGHFSDGHPPIMAAEWWVLDRIISGPLLMLLLQAALFLGGLYYLFRRVLSPRAAALVAAAIFVFPPVLTPMAVIWKDSQMAAYLVAGTAALVQPGRRARVLGLVLLVIAAAVRHNAFAAVVPIVFFVFEWRAGIRWWKRSMIVVAIAIAMVGAAVLITRVLSERHIRLTPVYPDLVGMIAYSDDMSDAELREILRGTPLVRTTNIQARARELTHEWAFRIVSGEDRLFNNPTYPEEWDALDRARNELVRRDPGAYFRSHWDPIAKMLGLTDPDIPGPIWNLFLEDTGTMFNVEHMATWSWAQYYAGVTFAWFHLHTPLFTPYIYALVALLLLVLVCRDRLTAGLLVSGLLYEASFFPFSPNPDYRYSHWMITATVISAVLIFIQRRQRGANTNARASGTSREIG